MRFSGAERGSDWQVGDHTISGAPMRRSVARAAHRRTPGCGSRRGNRASILFWSEMPTGDAIAEAWTFGLYQSIMPWWRNRRAGFRYGRRRFPPLPSLRQPAYRFRPADVCSADPRRYRDEQSERVPVSSCVLRNAPFEGDFPLLNHDV
jgi:hypothetical protein